MTSNGTYTVYAKDAAGNVAVKEIQIANIHTTAPDLVLSYSPTSSTTGSVTISVNATVYGTDSGNTLEKLNWLSGSRAAADFAGGTHGTDMIMTKEFSITANGTYTVYAKDAAGNEALEEIVISNISEAPSTDRDRNRRSSRTEQATRTEQAALNITQKPGGGIIFHVDPSMVVKSTSQDGTIIEEVLLEEAVLEEILTHLEGEEKPFVTILVDDSEGAVQVKLPSASLSAAMESYPNVLFEVMLDDSSFQLPVHVLDLSKLASQLDVRLQDMVVAVTLRKVDGQEKRLLDQAAAQQGLRNVQAVDFIVTVSSDMQAIEVKDFGGTYIVRAIVIEEFSEAKTWIAIYYDQDNLTLSFVPAVIAVRDDGKVEMKMSVPHNSIYAVMEVSGKTFSDMAGHWARQEVEQLTARLIIHGVTSDRYEPDESITRAEFAALLVRSLGLEVNEGASEIGFADVDSDAWYASVVATAVEAGLVSGTGAADAAYFAPNDPITREQMGS